MNKQLEKIIDTEYRNNDSLQIPHDWQITYSDFESIGAVQDKFKMISIAFQYGFMQGAKAHNKGRIKVTSRNNVIKA